MSTLPRSIWLLTLRHPLKIITEALVATAQCITIVGSTSRDRNAKNKAGAMTAPPPIPNKPAV